MTRVTQLIHDAGKYLLISVYPLPTHPTHNDTHNNGGNLETLPGWPKKLQHNRPARSAGQWPRLFVFCIVVVISSVLKEVLWYIYWPALRAGLLCCNFFGQPGSVSKFPLFVWVKLWVGWVGRGYTEISRYFPASWINWVTLVTKIKLLYSLRF